MAVGRLIHRCPCTPSGGDARVERTETGYRVRCFVCGTHGAEKDCGYKAIRSWNRTRLP